jgi:hypothetical protein
MGPGPKRGQRRSARTWRSPSRRGPSRARANSQGRRPSLVASGDHTLGLERICDALAAALDAERLVTPGAGHFLAAAEGFPERLERFLDRFSDS